MRPLAADVAWSVCLSVFLLVTTANLRKRLNRSRYHLNYEPGWARIRWGPGPLGKGVNFGVVPPIVLAANATQHGATGLSA